MKAARRKLNMAPEASLLQDGAKSEPKGAGRLPCPQTRALGTSGVPWDQLSEQKWELIYFPGELTTVNNAAIIRSHSWVLSRKDGMLRFNL